MSKEGIILHALPFQDHKRLLTVFTKEFGMVKLVAKAGQAGIDPLTRAEFSFNLKPGKDMANCREMTVMNYHYRLRKNLEWLRSGCDMAYAIKTSQIESTPAPLLYDLVVRYLEKIPVVADPKTLAASFYLKVLRHEGLADFEMEPPEIFSEEEVELVGCLAHTLSFQDLSTIECSATFLEKVQKFFSDLHRY